MIAKIGSFVAGLLLWVCVVILLGVTFIPAFLDRIYYQGALSDHFDGHHFENTDGAISFPMPPGVKPSRGNLATRFLFSDPDRPAWPDHVAVKQDKPPARIEGAAMRATWVGHATVLIQTAGLNILTDPLWSDHASPFPPLGPRRVAAPGIDFGDLPKIDIVVISHNHYDHMDLSTLKKLWRRDRPLIVTSLGNDTIIKGAGAQAKALDWGEAVQVKGATVHVLRNHHWSSRWGRDRNRALWSAFLIETAAGNIFFAGDTGAGDMRWPQAARDIGPVRLALIPIGAFRFYAGQMDTSSHIGPEQAVDLFEALAPAQAIPIHWGTIRLSNEGWDTPPKMLDIFARCRGVEPDRFLPRRIGEAIMVPEEPAPHRAVSAQARQDCQPDSAALRALK
ncbi:MAG: MBL fold metallo-hydrolase [Sphingobium sp.]